MGVWLKARGRAITMRDGKEPSDPIVKVGPEPVFLSKLDAVDFEFDSDLEVAPPPKKPKATPKPDAVAEKAEVKDNAGVGKPGGRSKARNV